MRLTLVDNLVLPAERDLYLLDVHPHLGLLSLAAVAVADGHQVAIYDPKRQVRNGDLPYDETLYEMAADQILLCQPDVVGLTTLGCSFLFALGVGRILKRRAPELPLLLGGPHATMLARPILERYTAFDVVVRHEAEETLPAVLACLATMKFADVPGVSWRTRGGVEETPGSPRIENLDTLPALDYELYPMHDLDLELIRVEAGRGCPFACTFCSTATFFQRRHRLKSPARLVSEMDTLRDRYSPREFKLDHDLFTVNRDKVLAFCDAVGDRGHKWRVSARIDCVDGELLERMAAAGCVGLYFGVETGSRRMQKISKKRLDLDLVAATLDLCERLGIESTTSFITGYPEEHAEDQLETLNMLGLCFSRPARACIPQLHILTPEPGTSLFNQFGDRLEFDGYATPFNARLMRAEDRQDVLREPTIFSSYYYYPASLPRQTHVAVVETVDLLRKLDRRILAALISRHDGRLADLVYRLISLAPDSVRGPVPGFGEIERYVRHLLGDEDPLTSAVRYSLFAHCQATPTVYAPHRSAVVTDPRGTYRLTGGAQILHDVHDCAQVMAWLERADNSTMAVEFRRVSYVRLPGRPRPLQMEPGGALLISLFKNGQTPGGVMQALGWPDGIHHAEEWLPNLVQAGLLVACPGGPPIDAP